MALLSVGTFDGRKVGSRKKKNLSFRTSLRREGAKERCTSYCLFRCSRVKEGTEAARTASQEKREPGNRRGEGGARARIWERGW